MAGIESRLDERYSFEMNGLVGPIGVRAKSFMIFTAAAALATVPAGAQVRTGLATQVVPVRPAATQPKPVTVPPRTAPDAPVPGNPDFAPQQVTPTTPAPAPVP